MGLCRPLVVLLVVYYSSCTCHPTKIAPSMFYHDVATSLAPFNGFQMPPCIGNYFPSLFPRVNIFPDSLCTCCPFGAKTHQMRTYCLNFKVFSRKFAIFYAVMVEASANVYRVNKLLEIEAADWQRHLERAVGGSFSPLLARSSFPFFNFNFPW